MDELGRTLLALSLHDEQAVHDLLERGRDHPATPVAVVRTTLTVQVGGLICLGAETATFQLFVDRALAAGLEPDDLLRVLGALAPVVGSARLAAGAGSLARALGYDLDGALELHDRGAAAERLPATPSDPGAPPPNRPEGTGPDGSS